MPVHPHLPAAEPAMPIWQALEARITRDGIEIDRPKGSRHPRFPDRVYPLDYGFIRGTAAVDGGGLDVFVGTLRQHAVTGLLATFDDTKGDAEIKVLFDCTPREIDTVEHWLGQMISIVPIIRDDPPPSISLVTEDKRRFLDLLLLADEQEDMIDRYLDRGDLFVMDAGEAVVAVCVVTDEGGGLFEVQNLAVHPNWQRHGFGRAMLDHVAAWYQGRATTLLVGTGDSPLTLPFYQSCGFIFDHRVPRGIADVYDHPVIEADVQLIDKVYLRKDLTD